MTYESLHIPSRTRNEIITTPHNLRDTSHSWPSWPQGLYKTLFRIFVVSLFRCFALSQFRTFVVSYFRSFALSLFHTFAVSLFRTFVVFPLPFLPLHSPLCITCVVHWSNAASMFFERRQRWSILNQLWANVVCFWLIMLNSICG